MEIDTSADGNGCACLGCCVFCVLVVVGIPLGCCFGLLLPIPPLFG